ncbi:unnamed protein product [Rangifer tarandus platyrhynchus]|uniref:Uncharacterized protein n=1 Tax=Rangifer tarandus platyrhynchus TaxID=3082113 RepID=A0ABN8YML2_RANTA|nr:unnamed protein product [Rangifer tarandus platyrhynchus]
MHGKEVSHLSPLSALQANACDASFSTSAPPAAQAAILEHAEGCQDPQDPDSIHSTSISARSVPLNNLRACEPLSPGRHLPQSPLDPERLSELDLEKELTKHPETWVGNLSGGQACSSGHTLIAAGALAPSHHPPSRERQVLPFTESSSCEQCEQVSPWAGRLLGFGGLRWKPSSGRQVYIYLESGGWVPTRAASQASADLVPAHMANLSLPTEPERDMHGQPEYVDVTLIDGGQCRQESSLAGNANTGEWRRHGSKCGEVTKGHPSSPNSPLPPTARKTGRDGWRTRRPGMDTAGTDQTIQETTAAWTSVPPAVRRHIHTCTHKCTVTPSHSPRPPGLPTDSQTALCEPQPRGAVRIPSPCAVGATQPGLARDPGPLSSGSAQNTGLSRECAHVRPDQGRRAEGLGRVHTPNPRQTVGCRLPEAGKGESDEVSQEGVPSKEVTAICTPSQVPASPSLRGPIRTQPPKLDGPNEVHATGAMPSSIIWGREGRDLTNVIKQLVELAFLEQALLLKSGTVEERPSCRSAFPAQPEFSMLEGTL